MIFLVIRYVISALLVLAWLWVLGKPLYAMWKGRRLRLAGASPERSGSSLSWVGKPVRSWMDQSVFARRRATLLGFAFAFGGSLFLLIAYRGLHFLIVSGLLFVGLLSYLLVGARVGGQMLRREVSRLRSERKGRPRRPSLLDDPGLQPSSLTDLVGSQDETEVVERELPSPTSLDDAEDYTDATLLVEGSRDRRPPSHVSGNVSPDGAVASDEELEEYADRDGHRRAS